MNIKIRKIEFRPPNGDDKSYMAFFYINGYKAGIVTKDAGNGPTQLVGLGSRGEQLIQEANVFFKEFQPVHVIYREPVKPTLALFLDSLANVVELDRPLTDIARLREHIGKQMNASIVYGTPDRTCFTRRFGKSLAELQKTPEGVAKLGRELWHIQSNLRQGEVIYNTNLVPELQELAQKRDYRELPETLKAMITRNVIRPGKTSRRHGIK